MASTLKLRFGISDSPAAIQPTVGECAEAVLAHADTLMRSMLTGLAASLGRAASRQNPALSSPEVRAALATLLSRAPWVAQQFRRDLSREIYHGGGEHDNHMDLLRFDDLQLFEDADLSQSIEAARAQQEVTMAVDDVLAPLDALLSALLGWRTVQPGLNPLRPAVFVRALQSCLTAEVADPSARDALIAPLAGLMGAELRVMYREITDWLRSSGVEPAMVAGSKLGADPRGATGAVAKTLLTLGKLRRLLAGDFDLKPQPADFAPTVPESLVALQQLKQVDALVQRLADRSAQAEAGGAATDDATAAAPAVLPWGADEDEAPKLGHLLGAEVVRMMFDNLAQDTRLLPPLRQSLRDIERLMTRLAREDSRFFTDRRHAGRRLLDAVVQRSLAFSSESAEGWTGFMATVDEAVASLADKVVDADTLADLTGDLQALWETEDLQARARRAEAARALAHAEQRHLLAQKLAVDFVQAMDGVAVAEFVRDFLLHVWSQVVAETRLSDRDGDADPFGYRSLADDLIWSVQRTTAQRGRARRLENMIPNLIDRLRAGLEHIDYPPAATETFFKHLVALHRAAIEDGRDLAAQAAAQAAAQTAEAAPSVYAADMDPDADPWLAEHEVAESGYVGGQSLLPADSDIDVARDGQGAVPVVDEVADAPSLEDPAALRTGSWLELMVNGQWLRVQLTWATPHATLFMFTSAAGTAHSMSRRTLERLRLAGQMRTIAARPVIDEALDQVAKAALRNSLSEPR